MNEKDCGVERPAAVTEAQERHLKAFPLCVCCRKGTNLQFKTQAHHVIPFHYCIALDRAPAASDARNFITLCETEQGDAADNHHLLVGHLGNFKEANLNVMHDATLTYYGFSKAALTASLAFETQIKTLRLKPLEDLTDANKVQLVALIDRWFPQNDPSHVPDYVVTDAELKELS